METAAIKTMTRYDAIEQLKRYFSIKELVAPEIYKRDGELAWRYLRTELIETLLIIRRDILKVPMIINNASRTQAGLRSNISELVAEHTKKGELYISAHSLGAAVDVVFTKSSGMTVDKARNLIKQNKNLFVYPIRLEKESNWLHIDVYDNGNGIMITEFNG